MLLAILNDYLLWLCPVWAEALRRKEKWDFFPFSGIWEVVVFMPLICYLLSVWEAIWLSQCGQGKWNFVSWLKIFWNSQPVVLNLFFQLFALKNYKLQKICKNSKISAHVLCLHLPVVFATYALSLVISCRYCIQSSSSTLVLIVD